MKNKTLFPFKIMLITVWWHIFLTGHRKGCQSIVDGSDLENYDEFGKSHFSTATYNERELDVKCTFNTHWALVEQWQQCQTTHGGKKVNSRQQIWLVTAPCWPPLCLEMLYATCTRQLISQFSIWQWMRICCRTLERGINSLCRWWQGAGRSSQEGNAREKQMTKGVNLL